MAALPDLSAPISTWMPLATYVGFRSGLPDVVMGRLHPAFGARIPYKTWICETPQELAAVTAALSRPAPRGPRGEVDFRSGPDSAVRGRARGLEPIGEVVAALYPPPDDGWPWLVLLCVPVQRDGERGIYSWEALETEADALAHLARMAKLAPGAISILRPDPRQ